MELPELNAGLRRKPALANPAAPQAGASGGAGSAGPSSGGADDGRVSREPPPTGSGASVAEGPSTSAGTGLAGPAHRPMGFAERFRDVLPAPTDAAPADTSRPQGQQAQAGPSGQPGPAAYVTLTGTMHGVIPPGHANNTQPVVPGQYLATTMVVSRRQQGNPVLKHLHNIRWQFGDVTPDFLLGASACALFLSLRFHNLHPDYLHIRIRELQTSFRLRVVLCHLDIEDTARPLGAISKTCTLSRCALICAWSPAECARYLETLKAFEFKPADLILGKVDRDYLSRLHTALTSVRGVNRSDVLSLGTTLGTLRNVMRASREQLEGCPGIGPTKARRLFAAFHEPFRKRARGTADETLPEKRAPEYVDFNRGAGAAAGVPAAAEGNVGGEDGEDGGVAPLRVVDEGPVAGAGAGMGGEEEGVEVGTRRATAFDVAQAFLGVGEEEFEGQEGGESGDEG